MPTNGSHVASIIKKKVRNRLHQYLWKKINWRQQVQKIFHNRRKWTNGEREKENNIMRIQIIYILQTTSWSIINPLERKDPRTLLG